MLFPPLLPLYLGCLNPSWQWILNENITRNYVFIELIELKQAAILGLKSPSLPTYMKYPLLAQVGISVLSKRSDDIKARKYSFNRSEVCSKSQNELKTWGFWTPIDNLWRDWHTTDCMTDHEFCEKYLLTAYKGIFLVFSGSTRRFSSTPVAKANRSAILTLILIWAFLKIGEYHWGVSLGYSPILAKVYSVTWRV